MKIRKALLSLLVVGFIFALAQPTIAYQPDCDQSPELCDQPDEE